MTFFERIRFHLYALIVLEAYVRGGSRERLSGETLAHFAYDQAEDMIRVWRQRKALQAAREAAAKALGPDDHET